MRALSFPVRTVVLWGLALLASCIDPYTPDIISSAKRLLVVDGFINPTGISTFILSRSYDIASKTAPPAETAAIVTIEQENGPRYPLQEGTVKGTYTSASLTLDPTKNYRLRILTSGGKEYASTFVPVKTTPLIDKVTWQAEDNGLTISVSTHDDQRMTQYYRWEYEETWEIVPPYAPSVEYRNNRIQDITVPYPRICWGLAKSAPINVSSTTRLTQDVVSNYPLRSLPANSDLLYQRYSILVKQYAQTPDEYMYWDLLRKNTEQIGTLFDPLPTQLTGNVRCLNDESELALGYVGAHTMTTKRIFIERAELPRSWPVRSGYEACIPPDTVFLDRPSPPKPDPVVILQANFNPASGRLPISPLYNPGGLYGYLASSRLCIDCRLKGAAVKPSYWP